MGVWHALLVYLKRAMVNTLNKQTNKSFGKKKKNLKKKKSPGCSSKRSKFNSQDPHDRSHLSVTGVPGLLTLPHRYTYRQNTNTH
jgi:hypothetical protein